MDKEKGYLPTEPAEKRSPHHEVAQLVRDLSYLISDNEWGIKGKDKMELVYMYPLHKAQVLGFIETADMGELSNFYEKVAYDEEFKRVLVATVMRATTAASNEDDISDLWSVIRNISSFDRRAALTIAEKLQEKVVNGSITGERAERFAQHAMDEAAEEGDYVNTLSDEHLIDIIEGNQFDSLKKVAFSELLKRDHPYAIHIVEQSPQELVDAKVDYLILREIYTQKLLRGDFSRWAEAFSVDDESALKQAEFSVIAACQRKVPFDSENPDFVETVFGFRDDTFFESIGSIIKAGMTLHPSLVSKALNRLSVTLAEIEELDENKKQFIYAEHFVKYLCENKPNIAQNYWNEGIPVIKKFLDENG